MWAEKLTDVQTWFAVDVPKVTELPFDFRQEWNVAMSPFSVPGSARIFSGHPNANMKILYYYQNLKVTYFKGSTINIGTTRNLANYHR